MLTKKGKQHKQGQGAVRPGVALRQTKGTDDRPGANCIAEADPPLMNRLLSREKVANALGDGQATEDFNAHSRAHRVKTFGNVKTKPVGEVRPGVASLFSSFFQLVYQHVSQLVSFNLHRFFAQGRNNVFHFPLALGSPCVAQTRKTICNRFTVFHHETKSSMPGGQGWKMQREPLPKRPFETYQPTLSQRVIKHGLLFRVPGGKELQCRAFPHIQTWFRMIPNVFLTQTHAIIGFSKFGACMRWLGFSCFWPADVWSWWKRLRLRHAIAQCAYERCMLAALWDLLLLPWQTSNDTGGKTGDESFCEAIFPYLLVIGGSRVCMFVN